MKLGIRNVACVVQGDSRVEAIVRRRGAAGGLQVAIQGSRAGQQDRSRPKGGSPPVEPASQKVQRQHPQRGKEHRHELELVLELRLLIHRDVLREGLMGKKKSLK